MESEEVVFRVKGASSATSLGSVIAHSTYEGKKIVLRAIGAAAVNQANKAVAIARGLVAPRGYSLAMIPGFTDVSMPEEDATVTAMVLRIINI
jgi:stage V sporulation protein S